MTAVSAPNPSNRGCPSSLAGTTCRRDRSRISPYARRSTIRCRTDPSGRFRQCVTPLWFPRLTATIPAYSSLTRSTWTQPQLATGACSNFPTEPFPGLPIGARRAFPSLTVSAPNSSQKYNSLQNRRDHRPSHSRLDRRSRHGDRSIISLPPPQRASTLLAPMWLFCRLAFLQLRRNPWNTLRPNIACSLANLPSLSPAFSLETPPTCILGTEPNPCTRVGHYIQPPRGQLTAPGRPGDSLDQRRRIARIDVAGVSLQCRSFKASQGNSCHLSLDERASVAG